MRKVGLGLLVVVLSLALVITPVMAKAGGGSAAKGNSGNKGSAQTQNIAKGNSGNKESAKTQNMSKGNSGNKGNSTNKGQSKKDVKVSEKKAKGKADLTKGNNKAVQQRIQKRAEQTLKKQFKDTKGHWAQNKIQEMQQLGLIKGYEDGSFSPDSEVSQVEAMVMVVNLAELIDDENITDETDTTDTTTDDPENTDVDESSDETTIADDEEDISDVPVWARNQARKALGKIININRFHSHVQASRAQVAVMLGKALELEPIEVDENAFTDSLLISPEDIGYILALKEAGVITGTPDNKFNPNKAITRAEIATMLANVVDSIEDEEDEIEEDIDDPSDEDSTTDPTGEDNEDDATSTDETGSDTENTETPSENTNS